MEVKLHNHINQNNYRWLVVTNEIYENIHHRDFSYYKYKIQYWWHILVFKIMWSGFDKNSLFIQTYDMNNLKKWEVGKMTKDLIDSGYFNEINMMHKPRTKF